MEYDQFKRKNALIASEILAYLLSHPKARDTIEGIISWWLLEQMIVFQEMQVKNALSELVVKGFVVEKKGPDSRIHYQVNQSRIEDVKKVVRLMSE